MLNAAKKSVSVILAVMMLISVFAAVPTVASAENTAEEITTIYADNENTQWDAVYLYGWGASGLDGSAVPLTQIEGTNIWKLDLPQAIPAKQECFLFKNTSDADGWDQQTANLSYDGYNDCYLLAGHNNNTTAYRYGELPGVEEYQTAHPFEGGHSKSFTYRDPQASNLLITFSEETNVGYDAQIEVVASNGSRVAFGQGTQLAGKSIPIRGNGFTINFNSWTDNNDGLYGFSLSNIEADSLTFEDTDYDFYYLADDDYASNNNVEYKLNYCNVDGEWKTVNFAKTEMMINGKSVYKTTITEDVDGASFIQYQILENDNHRGQKEYSGVLKYSDFSNKIVNQNGDIIDLPEEITEGDFKLYYAGDTATITGYVGADTEVVIPKQIKGKTVTAIATEAFYANDDILEITVPDTVTYIGEDAFFDDTLVKGYKRAYVYNYCIKNYYDFEDISVESTGIALSSKYEGQDTFTILLGESKTFEFDLTPADTTDVVTLTSSNDNFSVNGTTVKAENCGYYWSNYDETTITATTTSGESCEFTVRMIWPRSAIINKMPDKLVYRVGEELDLTGMQFRVEYSDGSYKDVDNYNVSDYDFSTVGTKYIDVMYETGNSSFSQSFGVEVISDKGRTAGIRIAQYPEKVKYIRTDTELDTTGLKVELVYDSGEVEEIADYTIDETSYDLSTPGDYTVKLTYGSYSTSFNITVFRTQRQATAGEDPAQNDSSIITVYLIDDNGSGIGNVSLQGDNISEQHILDKTEEKYNDSDIYKLVYDSSLFTNVYFNGSNINASAECAGKYYSSSRSAWINSIATDMKTVYLIKPENWSETDIYAYVWGDGSGINKTGWPGEEVTATDYYNGNNRVYSYTYDANLYDRIIFNCDGSQTDNLIPEPGRYYRMEDNAWYDKSELEFTSIVEMRMKAVFSPDAEDDNIAKFGFDSSITLSGAKILGIQKRTDKTNAVRFVASISNSVLEKAVDYGYVFTTTTKDTATAKENAGKLTALNGHKFSCKDTYNTSAGEYGNPDSEKNYKYVTATVKNLPDDKAVVARFYVQTEDETYFYSTYNDKDGGTYDGCVVRWSEI